MRLEIDDFGQNEALNKSIRPYHRLLMDYWQKAGQPGFVHVIGRWEHLYVGLQEES
jgi:hypothetical protein